MVAPESLFDVQVKRIHEYKRQHLAALHILALFSGFVVSEDRSAGADVHLRRQSGARLFPGQTDHQADQRRRRNGECRSELFASARSGVCARLQRCGRGSLFIRPPICPSRFRLPGKDARAPANELFSQRRLTIGTFDGANVEIREEVGAENFFCLGSRSMESRTRRHAVIVRAICMSKTRPFVK